MIHPGRHRRSLLLLIAAQAVVLFLAGLSGAFAQVELLPLDHPATDALVRIYEYGAIPDFPREHLPISRRLALRLLDEAAADEHLPEQLRDIARYYAVELGADVGRTETAVLIKTRPSSTSVFDRPFDNLPLAYLEYRDSTYGARLVVEPIFDGEVRAATDGSAGSAVILQGGAQLRGTLIDRIGYAARVTNGTVVGDSLLVLRDPKFGHSGKFGVAGQNRDADFGSGHLRADFDVVAVEIGRERLQLGGGLDESLLIGSQLPSNVDYLRLTARVGRVAFSHVHASVLADPSGGTAFGPTTAIPSKYVAAHLISFGPFGGLRGSIGEAVVYSNRPFEIGYLNPLNFLKSQEHYLRDRDNSFMYASLSANPLDGLFLEGEFLLDDLKFGEIGNHYFGNKTAWRVGARTIAFPIPQVDLSASYTRIEPYTYSHTNAEDAYTHDGEPIAAGGLEPNSYLVEIGAAFIPLPNLRLRATVGLGEHGANVVSDTGVVRNVGGDVRVGRRGWDAYNVTFLDGTLEKLGRLKVQLEYEPLRDIGLRLILIDDSVGVGDTTTYDRQLWVGARIGVR